MSLTIHEEMRSNVHSSAAIRQPETRLEGATSQTHRRDKLRSVAAAKAETEFITQGAGAIEEETLFLAETRTAASRRHSDRESELDDGSATGDETIGDDQVFEDAVSHQISDDNSSVDSIRTEKQEDGRICYLIRGTVTINMNLK